MAMVPRQKNADNVGVALTQLPDDRPRRVGGSIVDQHDLVVIRHLGLTDDGEAMVKLGQALLLIETGSHDR
jgi:hypothetical protein